LRERVIVDHDGFGEYSDSNAPVDAILKPLGNLIKPVVAMLRGTKSMPVIGSGYDDRYTDYDGQSPTEDFTPEQLMLCPSIVNVYALDTKKWFEVAISNCKPVRWSTVALDHLVLAEKTKEMIRALVEQHTVNKGRVMNDVITGKGGVSLEPSARGLHANYSQGLIMVLHGPPGVGKTLTAGNLPRSLKV
jgi:hypothetical protein